MAETPDDFLESERAGQGLIPDRPFPRLVYWVGLEAKPEIQLLAVRREGHSLQTAWD